MGTQRPSEWANSLIIRFEEQLPYKTGHGIHSSQIDEEQCKCLVQISRYRFSLVISGLTKILQRINELYQSIIQGSCSRTHSDNEDVYHDSLVIVLDMLEKCLSAQPKDTTKYDEAMNVKILLRELLPFMDSRNETASTNLAFLKQLASKVLTALSLNFFNAVFNRISARLQELSSSSEENPDYTDIEMIQYINADLLRLLRLMQESVQKFKLLRKSAQMVLISSLEKAIWTWMDTYPHEYAEIQNRPNEELNKCCASLFDMMQECFVDHKKLRYATWPLQVMMLILSPKVLEEIVNADTGAPCSPKHSKKKLFIDTVKRALSPHNTSKQMIEAAIVTSLSLVKASTYINIHDSGNAMFVLVKAVVNDLKALLFNPNKSYIRGSLVSGHTELELLVDCFVALFRIMPHNNDASKACLNPNAHFMYHIVIVHSLMRIIKQPRLTWWPNIELFYPRAGDLRGLFTDILNKTTQSFIVHTPLRMISLSLKSKEVQGKLNKSDEMQAYKSLILWMVKLIHADPMLMLSGHSRSGLDLHSSTTDLINGLVSLVHQPAAQELSREAMDALRALHKPSRVHMWNPSNPMTTFLDLSSQVCYNISQKLIQRQMCNYREVLILLRDILTSRNEFLASHKECFDLLDKIPIYKQAHIKLEVVFFMSLWSIDTDAVIVGMSCFALLCAEADIRCGTDEMSAKLLLPNYTVLQEIAHTGTVVAAASHDIGTGCTNRNIQSIAALQKRILALLRKIEHSVDGVQPVWEESFRYWDSICRLLQKWPKGTGEKMDDHQTEGVHKAVAKRRGASHASCEHDLEMQIQEWANITGFLCALGGVCLQRKGFLPWNQYCGLAKFSMEYTRKYKVLPSSSQDVQYCPVTQFIGQLLRLLASSYTSEKIGPILQSHMKDMIGNEMSSALYPILFEQLKGIVDKFFDQNQQVIESETNTQFIDHVIFILRSILENKRSPQPEQLCYTSIEGLVLAMTRYVRHQELTVMTVHLRTGLCRVAEAMMKRRDDLTFRQEMKFRNKMVDYITDWVLGSSHQIAGPGGRPEPSTLNSYYFCRELDQACMEAVSALLHGLPLQPEESDQGNNQEAKSVVFLKYFTIFMNLLNDCCHEVELTETDQHATLRSTTVHPMSNLRNANIASGLMHSLEAVDSAIRTATIQAMSNLLSANIELGLERSKHLGYHNDTQTRAAFMEVLTKILQQGTQFDTPAESVLADRFEQLVQIVTMISDKGDLPIAMALANVVHSRHMDELAKVLVTLFDTKHLLSQFLWNVFFRELEGCECMQTLFRGNSLGSKIMSYCFKMFGGTYLHNLLEPLISDLIHRAECDSKLSFEVDVARLDPCQDINVNRRNLIELTKSFFDSIVDSADDFPPQLKSMCHCLYQVLSKRSPDSPQANVGAVGTMLFLRFINPAIVCPQERGVVDEPVPQQLKRGLMLMSKILQNIANHVEFSKEQHMLPFNHFLRQNFETGRKFFIQIASDCQSAVPTPAESTSYVGDTNVLALHRLLWNHMERIGDFLSCSRDQRAVGRRPFDKLATLLAYLGPPEYKPIDPFSNSGAFFPPYSRWSSMDMSASIFEEFLVKNNIYEKEELNKIETQCVFYQAGTSRAGNPVFYFISRRYRIGETSGDMFIYHVLLTLKPFCTQPYEIVMDFTHTSSDNRFTTDILQKWFSTIPEIALRNLQAAYVHNCSSWLREYTKYHGVILAPLKNNRKLIFVENLTRLSEYIDQDQFNLPGATVALEEDLKVYTDALLLCHRDTKVTIKVGPTALQVTGEEKCKVLGSMAHLNDVYYASEIDEVCLVDDNQFTLSIVNEAAPLSFIHDDCDVIAQGIIHMRNRWDLGQPHDTGHQRLCPKDVPGTLLNMALLNLGSCNPTLRSAAYNLLCAMTSTFHLKLEGQLMYSSGLCIPWNNTIFIKSVSEKLARKEPRLTLEFLLESISGFTRSTIELKHLCLEYMTPWLANLVKFCKNEQQKDKVVKILENLIELTIEETEMYPSVQAKIWGSIGKIPELIDMVLDCFIQKSQKSGLNSSNVETMADTAVALASANVELVSEKLIGRMCRALSKLTNYSFGLDSPPTDVMDKTCHSPTSILEQHMMWDDIAILSRYLLMLSFNNCLHVSQHLPYLFHVTTFLICAGTVTMRSATHCFVVNVIHSLATCTSDKSSENTQRVIRLSLDEFSLPKFYQMFGISKVKSAAVTAFGSPNNSHTEWFYDPHSAEGHVFTTADRERLSLQSLETVTDTLLEIVEAASQDIPECTWLETWTSLAKSFAFCFNPALQPRALIVFGCISKTITDAEMKQLLRILVKALESFNDLALLEAILLCFTRLQPLLRPESPIHRALFWVAISALQLDEPTLYAAGLALLEQNIQTLKSHNAFEDKTLEQVMLEAREPLEWHFKQLDNAVGLSFRSNFHFAVSGHLIKGFRHPSPAVWAKTVRVLTSLVGVVARGEDKFRVSRANVAYLTALVPVSEEVRSRCHLKHSVPKRPLKAYQHYNIDYHNASTLSLLSSAPSSCRSRRLKSWVALAGDSGNISGGNSTSVLSMCSGSSQSTSIQTSQTQDSETGRAHSLQHGPAGESSKSDVTDSDGFEVVEDESRGSPTTRAEDSRRVPTRTDTEQFSDKQGSTEKDSVSAESNVLLDPSILSEFTTAALVLTMLATLVKYSTDDDEIRVLYEYLSEGSVVFPKVFPVIHSLLDMKINHVLVHSKDRVILNAVQNIIQNMIATEEFSQQQLHYMQSCGFGGLWRFAGPFTKNACTASSGELFASCLEAMVDSCLPDQQEPAEPQPMYSHGPTEKSNLAT